MKYFIWAGLFLSITFACLANEPNPLLQHKRADSRPLYMTTLEPPALHQTEPIGKNEALSTDSNIETETVLAKKTKGIVLLGRKEDLNVVKNAEGVIIKDLVVPGNEQDLKDLLESNFIGEPLTLKRIGEIKKIILQYYVAHDNPIIVIEVPEQEISRGVLQLIIHNGKLGEVTFKGNQHFTSEELQKYINLEKGNAIDYDVLMSDMEWLNRSPFHHSTLYVTPGLFPGTTNIEFDTTDRSPLNVYAGADNTGNRYTGFDRFYAGFTATRFFKLDHILNYQFTGSNHWDRFQANVINYTIPLPWRHILLLVAGYEINKPKIHDFKARSNSLRTQIQYIIPLPTASRKLFHEVAIQLDFEDDLYKLDFVANNTSLSLQNVRAVKTDIALAYNGRLDTFPHRILFSAQLYYSPGGWLPHQSNATYQQLRPFAKNHYVFSDLYFEYDYTFSNGMLITQKLKGQISSTNLVFNTYTIADYYSVRGYQDYFDRDNAFVYNLDWMSPAIRMGKTQSGSLRALAFFDYGIGSNHTLIPGERRSQYASSVGPGIRFNWDPYGWLRLDYGIPLQRLRFSPQGYTGWLQFGAFLNF
ncbi:MAG TPA: ShlB/FhaC/HecB family hemolysin secretion/activation protein [Chlamydiales bacterium]|jgi:hemolysin activation/secretion protein